MRVAVVGSTGVLGRRVIPRLQERGHRVQALVRRPEQAAALGRADVAAFLGGILRADSLPPLVAGCDVVLHMATAVPRPGMLPSRSLRDFIRESNRGNPGRFRIPPRGGAGGVVARLILEDLMAELKTRPGGGSVRDFLAGITDPQRRRDCRTVLNIMQRELTLYLMPGFERFRRLLDRLGRHKLGKGCLYLKSLEDTRLPVLEELIRACVEHLRGGR